MTSSGCRRTISSQGSRERGYWQRRLQQPRRKELTRSLAAIDPKAADLLRSFATASGDAALRIAVDLARHTLGVDGFFEWTSERS